MLVISYGSFEVEEVQGSLHLPPPQARGSLLTSFCAKAKLVFGRRLVSRLNFIVWYGFVGINFLIKMHNCFKSTIANLTNFVEVTLYRYRPRESAGKKGEKAGI